MLRFHRLALHKNSSIIDDFFAGGSDWLFLHESSDAKLVSLELNTPHSSLLTPHSSLLTLIGIIIVLFLDSSTIIYTFVAYNKIV